MGHTYRQSSIICLHSKLDFATVGYNFHNDIKINILHDVLGPQRLHDQSLMTLALTFSVNASDLKSINRVRMKYKVIHLSDIATADGRSLEQKFLRDKDYQPQRNSFQWPMKHRVTVTDYGV